MANVGHKWKPGESGNPSGRPRKNKALTEILRKQGNRTVEDFDGVRRSGKRIIARALWQLTTTGQAQLMRDGEVITLKPSPHDWLDIVKWLYNRIDGPPKQSIDMEMSGSLETSGNYTAGEIIRSTTALMQALGGIGNNEDTGTPGDLDTTERPAVGGDSEPG